MIFSKNILNFSYFIKFFFFLLIIITYNLYDNIFLIKALNQYIKKPKISIFLPIYNKEKYIKKSIKTIQRQTLEDIEIVAINDFSNDTSLKILNEIAKKEKRIKIINNDKNYGLLYSRGVGIINCEGEYIMNLDPDDEFRGAKSLEFLYNKAKKLNLDLISFATLFKSNKKVIKKCTNYEKIYTQPKILESAFNSNFFLKDFLIWNKIIKKDLFFKAYDLFKSKIFGKKWNYHEDNIWSLLVNKYAKSMLCVNKLIYIYKDNKDSLMNKRYDIIELNSILYRHEMFKIIFKEKEEEKYLIGEYLEIISILEGNNKFFILIKKNNIIRNKFMKIFINFLQKYECSNIKKKIIIYFLNRINSY